MLKQYLFVDNRRSSGSYYSLNLFYNTSWPKKQTSKSGQLNIQVVFVDCSYVKTVFQYRELKWVDLPRLHEIYNKACGTICQRKLVRAESAMLHRSVTVEEAGTMSKPEANINLRSMEERDFNAFSVSSVTIIKLLFPSISTVRYSKLLMRVSNLLVNIYKRKYESVM